MIFAYPDAGTPPTVFRATAGMQCGETTPGETIDPKWPATNLVRETSSASMSLNSHAKMGSRRLSINISSS